MRLRPINMFLITLLGFATTTLMASEHQRTLSAPALGDTKVVSMPSIYAWAAEAAKSPYRQGFEPQAAIKILVEVFEGALDPSEAAYAISSLCNPLLQQGFKDSPVGEL